MTLTALKSRFFPSSFFPIPLDFQNIPRRIEWKTRRGDITAGEGKDRREAVGWESTTAGNAKQQTRSRGRTLLDRGHSSSPGQLVVSMTCHAENV
jgi:hypothetical protein